MQDIRCGKCRKKLGAGVYTQLSIKCPRCGLMNDLRAESPEPERHGASSMERFNGNKKNSETTR